LLTIQHQMLAAESSRSQSASETKMQQKQTPVTL